MAGLTVMPLSAVEAGSRFAAAWNAAAHARTGDVFYRRDYLAAASLHEDGAVVLALFEHDAGIVLYPFVLRSLERLPLPASLTHGRHDMITPYEYGGPLLQAEAELDVLVLRQAFDDALAAWCRERGVVGEFVRFHPLLATHLGWEGRYELLLSSANVVIDVQRDDAALLAEMRGAARRAILAALRRGVAVTRLDDTQGAARLGALYRANMDRLAAQQAYYFSDSYFASLAALDPHGQLFAVAANDHDLAGAAVFLSSDTLAHYHLSSTDRRFSHLNATNLLIWHAVQCFRANGQRWLHLGGAAASQPGLRAFKEGFSPMRRDYWVGKRVRDTAAYLALCAAAGSDASTGFFPAYRRSSTAQPADAVG